MEKCSSCGIEVMIGYVKFKCPQCSREELVRCSSCRVLGTKYNCSSCNFIGP